ncbi:MAG: hypothetical protein ACRDKB_14975 [Actinomycetota bacterium]
MRLLVWERELREIMSYLARALDISGATGSIENAREALEDGKVRRAAFLAVKQTRDIPGDAYGHSA